MRHVPYVFFTITGLDTHLGKNIALRILGSTSFDTSVVEATAPSCIIPGRPRMMLYEDDALTIIKSTITVLLITRLFIPFYSDGAYVFQPGRLGVLAVVVSLGSFGQASWTQAANECPGYHDIRSVSHVQSFFAEPGYVIFLVIHPATVVCRGSRLGFFGIFVAVKSLPGTCPSTGEAIDAFGCESELLGPPASLATAVGSISGSPGFPVASSMHVLYVEPISLGTLSTLIDAFISVSNAQKALYVLKKIIQNERLPVSLDKNRGILKEAVVKLLDDILTCSEVKKLIADGKVSVHPLQTGGS
nr:putative pentatricopeptide repeat-containing protein At5g08310, mitochondrial [Tanacetum cinerariifolium]